MRNSIQDFSLANPIYAGATVSFYTVSAGVKTTTLATLYSGLTGTTTLTNPQSLDSDGKFQQPVYIDAPVIATVSGLTIADHDTGIVQAVLSASSVADVLDDLAASTGASLVGYIVSGTGAVAKTVQAKLREIVSVKDFGAVGDGVTNDTAAFTAAAAAAAALYIPPGNYLIAQVTFPSTCKTVRGCGEASKLTATGSYTAFAPWLLFNGTTDIDVGDFTLNVDTTTYATNHAMQFGGCTRGTVSNIHMIEGGYIGVYAPGCVDVMFDNVMIDAFAVSMFLADTSPNRLQVSRFRSATTGTGHSIGITGGSFHNIHNNHVTGGGSTYFGIMLYQANDSRIGENTVYATTLEGIQITDGNRNQIENNLVFCGPSHADFGISIFADGAAIEHNKISGNTVISSGGPGIGVSASYTPSARVCQLNSITDNIIINPCQSTVVAPCAIELLGGVTCSGNIVQGNTCVDSSNVMVYGAYEWNSGGNPDNNKLIHNPCFGGAGFVSEGYVVGTSSEVYDLVWNDYASVVTSQTGTITTVNTGLTDFKYKRKGRQADIVALAAITTNGTGASSVQMSMPFSITGGTLCGRENGVTGYQLQGYSGGAGVLRIVNYDATYPGANGAQCYVSGTVSI